MVKNNIKNACLVVIGNEILTGRTQDKNINHIAKELFKVGILLNYVCVIPDIQKTIVKEIRRLKKDFDYVITTGGIGDGGIQAQITALRERLLDQLTELEARVDFEEDLPPLDGEALLQQLQAVRLELQQLVRDGERGDALRQGLRVALVGRPNVGKSSLLNRLSRRERAIVTDLPGTTRDLLESEIVLEGVPITLLDTAGIRSTDDAVEQLGIARSEEALATADVVLLVLDGHAGWTAEDAALLARIPEQIPRILVANKADLPAGAFPQPVDVQLSALEGTGEADLVQALLERCGAAGTEGVLLALNQRQRDLAVRAAEALARSQEVAAQQLPWDFWTIDLREAIRALGEITGEELTEAVLDRVFSRFCIGK